MVCAMTRTVLFVTIVVIFIFALPLFSEGQEPSSTAPLNDSAEILHLIDKTNVQDPALKQVLQQIGEKLALIKEYSYVEEVSSVAMNGELAYREERCFRRPNLFFGKLTQTNHVLQDMIGRLTYSVVDGKHLWRYVQNAPGSGPKMVERIKARGKFPPAEIEKMIKRHETPKIYKYNLQRLEQAGYSAEDIIRSGALLKPFRECDMATLKLEKQDASLWVFTAKPNKPMPDTYLIRLAINKNGGLLQKVEFMKADGKVFSTQLFLNVRLEPSLSKTFFTFCPPPGIEIKDDTDDIIQSFRRQGIKPRAKPAAPKP